MIAGDRLCRQCLILLVALAAFRLPHLTLSLYALQNIFKRLVFAAVQTETENSSTND